MPTKAIRRAEPKAPSSDNGLFSALTRQWWLVIPLSVIATALAFSYTANIQPEYRAETAVVLVGDNERLITEPAGGQTVVEEVNPLTDISNAYRTVAQIAALAAVEQRNLDTLESEGLSTNVVVWVPSRSPLIRIEAVADDPETAAASADRLVSLIQLDLDARQTNLGAPETERVFVDRISETSAVGGADFGGRSRARAVFIVVGIGLSIVVGLVVDGSIQAWRQRQQRLIAERQPIADAAGGGAEGDTTPNDNRAATLAQTLTFVVGNEKMARWLATDALLKLGEVGGKQNQAAVPVQAYRLAYVQACNHLNHSRPLADDRLASMPTGLDPSLWRSLLSMPVQARAAAALSVVAGLSRREVAWVVGLQERQVESLLRSVRLALNFDPVDADSEWLGQPEAESTGATEQPNWSSFSDFGSDSDEKSTVGTDGQPFRIVGRQSQSASE